MRFTTATVLAVAAGSAMAQRPTNTSIWYVDLHCLLTVH